MMLVSVTNILICKLTDIAGYEKRIEFGILGKSAFVDLGGSLTKADTDKSALQVPNRGLR